MKIKLFLATILFICYGCANESLPEVKEEVDFSINYQFWESGNMSRSGQTLYESFHNKYLKTKILTPTTYKLTFKNTDTQSTAVFQGKWGEKNLLRLLEGEYEVTGYARPTEYDKAGMDTISISFNEVVNITSKTNGIVLTAKHDSYMLMFDASSIKKIQYQYYTVHQYRSDLTRLDDIYFMFVKNFYGTKFNNTIELTRNNDKFTEISLDDLPFEKGKYYYFNDITESFDLPPMTAGN